MKRAFGTSQRVDLFLKANGKCANPNCQEELLPGWHADHKVPYSKNGPTEVANGQALCKTCNLKKGAKMNPNNENKVTLREWQEEAIQMFNSKMTSQKTDRSFLTVACPGAGKTFFALTLAKNLLTTQKISQIIVVVPTQNLKEQWEKEAHINGIELNAYFENGNGILTSDYQGIVATYHQIGNAPALFKRLCNNQPTLAIIDEIHHAGEDRSWGDGLLEAFQNSTYQVCLSGTPFRNDNNQIPFVNYQEDVEDGKTIFKCVPDFRYNYGRSVKEGVCNPVVFHPSDPNADIRWITKNEDKTYTFADEVDDITSSERLRHSLNTTGDLMKTMLQEANKQLDEIRLSDPSAGGLILTMGGGNSNSENEIKYEDDYARKVGKLLTQVTGETAVIVTYKEERASKKIEEFAKSNTKWIIAVKMISEGVDIPRLKTLVYSTNITTNLFFIQAVGRVVRRQKLQRSAHVFLPADPRLKEYARLIEEELNHVTELKETGGNKPISGDGPSTERVDQTFIEAQGGMGDPIFQNQDIPQAELARLSQISQTENTNIEPHVLWKIFKKYSMPIPVTQTVNHSDEIETLREQKDRLRREYVNAVNKYAARFAQLHHIPADFEGANKKISGQWNKRQHVDEIGYCSVENLEERIKGVNELISRLQIHGEQLDG